MPLRRTTTYSPLNQGCSSLMRSVLTMRERWMRTKRRVSSRASMRVIVSRKRCDFLAKVQADVVAGGFDPVEIVGAEEEDTPA